MAYNSGKAVGGPMHGYRISHDRDYYRMTVRGPLPEIDPEELMHKDVVVTIHTYLWHAQSGEWRWDNQNGGA